MNENEIIEQEQQIEEVINETSDEIMGQIAIQEELKRIEVQNNPTSTLPKEVKNSEDYKNAINIAHTIGNCVQIMLGYGLDYNNSVAIASNIIQNKVELEKVKKQTVVVDNQTL